MDASVSQAIGSWKQVSVPGITVTNGTIQVGESSNANAGNWVNVDDFTLVPSGGTTTSGGTTRGPTGGGSPVHAVGAGKCLDVPGGADQQHAGGHLRLQRRREPAVDTRLHRHPGHHDRDGADDEGRGPSRDGEPPAFVAPAGRGLPSSAHRPLHQCSDPPLHFWCDLGQGKTGRPHHSLVQLRLVAEPERRVARLELLRALEEADDLAVQGVGGHPVPELRREDRGAGRDHGVDALGHDPVRVLHLGDLREHVPLRLRRLVRTRATASGRLQLLSVLLHRGPLLGCESLVRAVLVGAHGGSPLHNGTQCADRA
ncbi:hypothetical protein SBRY_90085 [Actinacidiphila bryophytorum]|uniref:Uncharacterized protein n=1 Tax=Actinacidiphila bryophytorum TaxID=1436133 RepID=A0A9W4MH23_9ACTN|nr:hypothetical protein SBRY_90085 [Actinacidiphila bryophytorum]